MRSASRTCCRYLFFWRSPLQPGYSGRRAKLIGRKRRTFKLRHCPRMGLVAQAASLLLSRTPDKANQRFASRWCVAASCCYATCKSRGSIVTISIEELRDCAGIEDHCRDTTIKREGSTSPVAWRCWMRPVSLPAIAAIVLGRGAAPTTGSIDAVVLAARPDSQGDPARPVERGLAMNSS
jgi:hypothetical protein